MVHGTCHLGIDYDSHWRVTYRWHIFYFRGQGRNSPRFRLQQHFFVNRRHPSERGRYSGSSGWRADLSGAMHEKQNKHGRQDNRARFYIPCPKQVHRHNANYLSLSCDASFRWVDRWGCLFVFARSLLISQQYCHSYCLSGKRVSRYDIFLYRSIGMPDLFSGRLQQLSAMLGSLSLVFQQCRLVRRSTLRGLAQKVSQVSYRICLLCWHHPWTALCGQSNGQHIFTLRTKKRQSIGGLRRVMFQ
jgi:hypothetical protein